MNAIAKKKNIPNFSSISIMRLMFLYSRELCCKRHFFHSFKCKTALYFDFYFTASREMKLQTNNFCRITFDILLLLLFCELYKL